LSRRFDRSRHVSVVRPRGDRPPLAGRFPRRPGGFNVRRLRPVGWRAPVTGAWSRGRAVTRRWPPRSLASQVLCGVLAVGCFGAATWVVLRSGLLDIDRIEVLGASRLTSEQAAAAAGLRVGEPMAAVDAEAARADLEAVPWVRAARVERAFPNLVRVHLEERLPMASSAGPAGGYAVLDETGRVLSLHPERPAGLPEITGAGPPPPPGQWLPAASPVLQVVRVLSEPLRRQVTQGAAVGGSVVLRVGEREVRFGPPEQLEAKAAALSALLGHLGARPVAYVDVRVPSAPVVGPPLLAPPTASRPSPAPSSAPATRGTKPRD
jgi:cell division protein FtsQ